MKYLPVALFLCVVGCSESANPPDDATVADATDLDVSVEASIDASDSSLSDVSLDSVSSDITLDVPVSEDSGVRDSSADVDVLVEASVDAPTARDASADGPDVRD